MENVRQCLCQQLEAVKRSNKVNTSITTTCCCLIISLERLHVIHDTQFPTCTPINRIFKNLVLNKQLVVELEHSQSFAWDYIYGTAQPNYYLFYNIFYYTVV